MTATPSLPSLAELDVLAVDCQATAASPHGHLLEIGWARVSAPSLARSGLIGLPNGQRIFPAVARITGISDEMLRDGVDAGVAWRSLSADAAAMPQQPAPTVIHFARFEQPFLRALADGASPLDVVCTHEIAARLLPDLPRRSLRALAGYFGMAVGTLRRSSEHVAATAFVWRELARLLAIDGVTTWPDLRTWIATTSAGRTRSRRIWPMPRDVRLSLPDEPGIYRMLRTSGDVLYVGKAASLHHRVNSHFRHQRGLHERALEMLSQARAISFETTPTALEAALLEVDEIKRHRPPYNIALTLDDREIWFAAPDLGERSPRPSARCPAGPFPSAETLDQFAALARGSRTALGRGRWAPEPTIFEAGHARFCAAHPELVRQDLAVASRLLRLGSRLWREGRRDRDVDQEEPGGRPVAWTAETVQVSLEWLVLRAALARRRAKWLTRLAESAVGWTEPGVTVSRLLLVEDGEIASCGQTDRAIALPVPRGHLRPTAARREGFTVARFDRLRVLTTELKRVVAAGAPVAVRFGTGPALTGARLARALSCI